MNVGLKCSVGEDIYVLEWDINNDEKKRSKCDMCNGSGKINEYECPRCGGDGKITSHYRKKYRIKKYSVDKIIIGDYMKDVLDKDGKKSRNLLSKLYAACSASSCGTKEDYANLFGNTYIYKRGLVETSAREEDIYVSYDDAKAECDRLNGLPYEKYKPHGRFRWL